MINWRIQKKPGWVWAFTLFLLLIVVQGALRKWVFPGLAGPLYIAKDVALLTAFTLYVLRHGLRVPSTLKKGLFPVLWLGLAVITFLQMFNINLPGPANAIIGFKSYMFYTVLLMLVPFYLDQIAVPYLFIRKAVIVVFVPVLILGFLQ